MRRYLELLEDTGCALRLFYKYYRWEKVKEVIEKRITNGIEEEFVVDSGIRIRIGWNDECCFARCVNETGLPFTLNDAFKELIQRYDSDEYSEGMDYSDRLLENLESELLGYTPEQRMYVIRRIISASSEILLNPRRNRFLRESLFSIETEKKIVYNAVGTDEEIVIYGSDDTLGVFDAISVASWLLTTAIDFLAGFGDICRYFKIPLKDEILNIIKPGKRLESIDLELVGIEDEVKNSLEKDVVSTPDICLRGRRESEATVKMKCEVITALIKVSGYELPTGKALASFIAWLCGGNMENIRQRGLSQNTMGTENQEIIKAKFESIGISYEDGKIRPIIKK